jgi:putative inorganic carbon (hco3(-)) transporter
MLKKTRTWIFYFFIFFASFSKAAIYIASSLLLILWLIEKIGTFKWKILRYFADSELKLPLFILFSVCLLSACISIAPQASWRGLFGKYFLFIMLFFLTQDTIDTEQKLWNVFKILTLSFFLVAANGLYQLATGSGFIDGRPLEGGKHVNCVFSSLNAFGTYLVFVAPIVLNFIFHNYKIKIIFKIVLISIVLSLLAFSFSAEAWISLSLSIVIVSLLTKSRYSRIGLCLILFFLIYLFILPASHNRLMGLNIQFNKGGRIELWRRTLTAWKERPVLGFGVSALHAKAMREHLHYSALAILHPHSLYLAILLETGILGLASFIWCVWRIFVKLFSLKNSSIGLGFLTGFFSFFLVSLTDYIFEIRIQAVFWVIIGLAFTYAKLNLSPRFERHR